MQTMTTFFSHPFFSVVGGLTTLLALCGVMISVFWVMKGVFPVWYRIGKSLSKRKITIFADDKHNELKSLLLDSGLFRECNIICANRADRDKARNTSLYIVHYLSAKDYLDDLLSMKKDSDALIVYAPAEEERIEPEVMAKIGNKRNTTTVNFRGRLLNDVLTSMITTGFQQN